MVEQAQIKGIVLVVDDDEAVRSGLYWTLISDYQVFQASSREEAIALINAQVIDVVVTDLQREEADEDRLPRHRLPGLPGFFSRRSDRTHKRPGNRCRGNRSSSASSR